ncbi:Locus-specific chromosome binding proteins protein [Dioscorea alata]|uniref:Locus-specific chromosome binding proteins protein n=2 Tax=Dioscorea alata TaxID=55571 RepID=A0ACB7TVR9_DIOAL|nr:Locus-specific chromosome binding proteins protein [Dioscorea alata]KAH7652304.1 Locus-specific chromosome binding proteins protein [Dioscorea alata]
MQRGRRGGPVTREAAAAAAAAAAAREPPPQVVKVKREVVVGCMTCPLCLKLLSEATTISECLHTFCKKCILEKFNDEEIDYCPVCKTDLGCAPEDKLRPDHSLQDIRAKIFPPKGKKVTAPEVTPSVPSPVRRKERSISSLVVNTPRIAAQSALTGKRTKAVGRRAANLSAPSPPINECAIKDNDDDLMEDLSSPETLSKIIQNKKQGTSIAEPSNLVSHRDLGNGGDPFLNKAEYWKPLNCLVEAANRTKPLRSSSPQNPVVKVEQANGLDIDAHLPKIKAREHANKSKAQDDKNGSASLPQIPPKAKRSSGAGRKRKDNATSVQALIDAAGKRERRISPVWFSLLASANQEGNPPFPQISANYLRIKDGNLLASILHKYLAKKLDLQSEAEVEITCRGQSVAPTMALHNLVDLWLRAGSSSRVQATLGNPAKEFVMVLSYGRKVIAS